MGSVWGELKRRNVVKVAVAYAVVGWLLIEIASTVLPTFQAPLWVLQTTTFVIILGFPLAVVLAWVFDLTPSGVERTESSQHAGSTTSVGGRKLNFAIIGALVIALGFVVVDNYLPESGPFAGAEVDPASLDPALDESPSTVVGEAADTAVADPRSIAALPFSNESAAAENAEFLANGIHDDLLTQLAKISGLKVISRTSVMEYRDTQKNMREIGRELGVATILEGRVQRAGDMVRINVQLIDAGTDEHLWANIYNRELTAQNIFSIQGEMAISIAQALQATLSPEEVARLNEVPTQSTLAWELFQSGNEVLRGTDNSSVYPLAAEVYERAVSEDPEFALAWAALSRGYSGMYFFGVDPTESRRELALESLDRAFSLSPDLPEAHLAKGYYHYHGFRDYESALQEFEIAELGMPGDAQIPQARARVARRLGRWEDALVSMGRATQLDPRNLEQLSFQATTQNALRNYSESSEILSRILEIRPDNTLAQLVLSQNEMERSGDPSLLTTLIDNPRIALPADLRAWSGWRAALYARDYESALSYLDFWNAEIDEGPYSYVPLASYYGVTHHLAGRAETAAPLFQSARVAIEQALELRPEDPRLHVALAEVFVGLGEPGAAVSAALQGIRLLSGINDATMGHNVLHAAIVRAIAPAGDIDVAVVQLDAYLANPGYWSIEGMLPDPRLDPIRDDPRFQALVDEYSRQ